MTTKNGWTEELDRLQARIAKLESENETLCRDNEFLAGVVGYEMERVRP